MLRNYVCGMAIALLVYPQGNVEAQEIEEIVVTAQKRQQAVMDVPISITAFTQEQLGNFGIENTVDLAAYTPGMVIGQTSGDGDYAFISLRGVVLRDFAATNESPSAVYLDEFYKANLVGLDQQIFDISRVEVLRGPQGTLYGRNATGGLIKYVTNAPTRELDGYAEVLVGDYNRYKFDGAISGPLTDTISGRISLLHHEHDGWIENIFPGGEDGNALDATSVRGQLLFGNSESAQFSLLIQDSWNDNDAGNMFPHFAVIADPDTGLAVPNRNGPGFNGYIEATPDDLRDTNSDRDIFLETDQTTIIGRGEWTIGELGLVSITGYEDSYKNGTFDSDGTPFTRGTQGESDSTQLSQEIRVSGSTERIEWLGGAYFFDYDIDGVQSRCTPETCDVQRGPVFFDLQSRSWAVFGNVDFKLTSELSLTTGIRYTEEEKEYSLNNTDFGTVFDVTTFGDLAKQDDDNISYNVRLNWTNNDNLLFYAGVASSFKGGAFNVGFTPILPEAIPVGPEELTSYEVGFKSDLMNNALRVNGAVFYYNYDDSQAFQFDGRLLTATIFNVDSEIYGGELEIIARPIGNLELFLAAGYLHGTLKDISVPGPTFSGLPPEDKQMPLAPRWDLSAVARYGFEVPGGGTVVLQGGMNYVSEQFFDAVNSPAHFEPSYTVADARIFWYSADERWKVSVFAENVFDEEYRTFSFDLAFLGFATDVFAKPRWVGGTIGYRF